MDGGRSSVGGFVERPWKIIGKEYKGNLKYDWRFAMPSLEKISHEYWNYFGSRLPVHSTTRIIRVIISHISGVRAN